jgi:hypothetical protein
MRLLIIAALIAAVAPVPCAAQSDAPVARPEVKVGDQWTYRRMDYWKNRTTSTYQLRVTFANGKSILAVVEEGGKEFDSSYTGDWNAIVSAFDQAVISPDTGLLHFPLQRGASYASAFQLDATKREAGARAIQGVSTSDLDLKVKVAGWEDVAVPAGKFRALRIESEGGVRRQQGFNPSGGPAPSTRGFARIVVWYVPEVKRWVKYTYDDSIMQFAGLMSPNERIGEELVEFRLQ